MTSIDTLPSPVPVLPAVLDLAAAEPLHRQLCDALQAGDVLVDAAAVDRVSTPCLQVLCAVAVAARASGFKFGLRNPSETLIAAAIELGLHHALRIES